jgi:chromate reductase
MYRLVLISGSQRNGSLNNRLIQLVGELAERRNDIIEVSRLDITTFPFYDADVETASIPPKIARSKLLVANADGVAISTPEYNGAPPGVLKNALDWLSRPWGACALTGKPVVTASAAPGEGGALKAHRKLREMLAIIGADVIGDERCSIPYADRLWVPTQVAADSDIVRQLRSLLDSLVDAAARIAAAA